MISRASRQVASTVFITGMLLIGFGFLIYLLPEFFATLAAMFFFFVGGICAVTAVKMFLTQNKIDRMNTDDSDAYRKNVKIRSE